MNLPFRMLGQGLFPFFVFLPVTGPAAAARHGQARQGTVADREESEISL